MATSTLMTVEEFAALPEDGHMHELVDGELLSMPPPHFLHSDIVALILKSLVLFLDRTGLGRAFAEAGFALFEDPPTVRQPDLSVLTTESLASRPREGYYRGAPDVAIEVLSPSDGADDLHLKIRQYLGTGAKAVIVVSPRARGKFGSIGRKDRPKRCAVSSRSSWLTPCPDGRCPSGRSSRRSIVPAARARLQPFPLRLNLLDTVGRCAESRKPWR